MDGQRINRVSGRVILVLSLLITVLATVLLEYTQPQTLGVAFGALYYLEHLR